MSNKFVFYKYSKYVKALAEVGFHKFEILNMERELKKKTKYL